MLPQRHPWPSHITPLTPLISYTSVFTFKLRKPTSYISSYLSSYNRTLIQFWEELAWQNSAVLIDVAVCLGVVESCAAALHKLLRVASHCRHKSHARHDVWFWRMVSRPRRQFVLAGLAKLISSDKKLNSPAYRLMWSCIYIYISYIYIFLYIYIYLYSRYDR